MWGGEPQKWSMGNSFAKHQHCRANPINCRQIHLSCGPRQLWQARTVFSDGYCQFLFLFFLLVWIHNLFWNKQNCKTLTKSEAISIVCFSRCGLTKFVCIHCLFAKWPERQVPLGQQARLKQGSTAGPLLGECGPQRFKDLQHSFLDAAPAKNSGQIKWKGSKYLGYRQVHTVASFPCASCLAGTVLYWVLPGLWNCVSWGQFQFQCRAVKNDIITSVSDFSQ